MELLTRPCGCAHAGGAARRATHAAVQRAAAPTPAPKLRALASQRAVAAHAPCRAARQPALHAQRRRSVRVAAGADAQARALHSFRMCCLCACTHASTRCCPQSTAGLSAEEAFCVANFYPWVKDAEGARKCLAFLREKEQARRVRGDGTRSFAATASARAAPRCHDRARLQALRCTVRTGRGADAASARELHAGCCFRRRQRRN
jgi:hypothetical protein